MSRQVGCLHRSISHPPNFQNNLPIIPLLLSPHLNHLIETFHPAWNQILIPIQQYMTLSPNSTTPISKQPTILPTLNPVYLHFPNLPFNLSISKSRLNPPPLLLPFHMLHPYIPLKPVNHSITTTQTTHKNHTSLITS